MSELMNGQSAGTGKDAVVCFVFCIQSSSLQLLGTSYCAVGSLPSLEQLALLDLCAQSPAQCLHLPIQLTRNG